KKDIEGERGDPPGDNPGGGVVVGKIRVHQRCDAAAGVDRAQDAKEPPRRDRDDGDAEREADPVPADPLVAEHRRPMQRVEHSALTILRSPLHRSTRDATSRTPISSLQRPMSNPGVATAPRVGVSSRWPVTTSKLRAGARGLARRQVAPWRSLAI